MSLNRREEMREAIARAKAIDPDDPEVIAADSNIRGDIDGEVNAAVEDLRRAAAIAPGNSNIWNSIGLFESDRDRPIAAEEALRRAIADDPDSPVSYANLAILLLDQSRVDEAGALIDKALALDPAFSVGYIARGRYLLQKGEIRQGPRGHPRRIGRQSRPIRKACSSRPSPITRTATRNWPMQALDNADRLDPNDPVVADRPHGHRDRPVSGRRGGARAPAKPCAATASAAAITRALPSTRKAAPIRPRPIAS